MSPGSHAKGIRFRIDSFGLPWNMPQSMRTFARSVVSRNCEPVTVVAPPRNWICIHAWLQPTRTDAYPPLRMDIAAVEQSFADLLAAFGDLVVARTAGTSLDKGSGSTRALVRRHPNPP